MVTDLGAVRQARLADSHLYLCTDGRRAQGDLAEFLEAVLRGGVDIVQLREKGLEAREELALLDVVRDACGRHGALMAVNDRADIALAASADVLHLGQDDLEPRIARRIVGHDVLLGLSTHGPEQAALVSAAGEPSVDYYCAGPVWTTPTKPGRPAVGITAIADAAQNDRGVPWFAIGGIDSGERLDAVLDAGATRIVVVRALTEASDPEAAARGLAERLRSACAT
ncbi:MAG TPA: thiamine phosphate synthase [Mycobacteriales bacterium]|nr:thiamine phosphate synthase [Mycobacteriales bacterium]